MKKVYIIGAGPGRPDLITLRGLNVLKEADVVIYDYLIDRALLEYVKEGAELICSGRLAKKGRYSGASPAAQSRIDDLVVKKVKEGRNVVRLKNGDPSIFGREKEELENLLKNRIAPEIVPGITAASAASSSSGIPLTDRKLASSCIFVTGREEEGKKGSLIDWNAVARSGTVVLYMSACNIKAVVKKLLHAGRSGVTPAGVIQDATLPAQKVVIGTLNNIAQRSQRRGVKPPAIIVIGAVAAFGKRFSRLRRGSRALFTGLSGERFFTNKAYFHLPLIKIVPLESYGRFDNQLRRLDTFDWIVFASRYGVEYFFKRLKAIGRDSRALCGIKIAAIGNSTKGRLSGFGIAADLVPRRESSKGLLESFRKIDIKGKRVFMPRSDLSDKGLKSGFEKLGASVTTRIAYRNIMPEGLPDIDLKFFDEIIFTSPSTVRNFKRRYGGVPDNVRIKCIGGATLKEAGRCRLLN